ncbi:50S ribosomal protein L22 [Thermoclostridium stercorarium subsp. thermolacticum DSM 2910]|nr:50S ribosomal protein L22 [Thermoclostridium stercorarium]AGI40540.1 ribosomal protein L22P [Thermoclostridium stercorarium subsp. stercorarium DSM 8532]ANW99819.1 50S ribosomal protein L22 [Thermoclostridium stercorarium subsp. thermolacticum DSM 2910]ANX02446.1 50S ribosomal protein L22 [Thermoclostridium stercorarium subsp. leptospartum DSM 9219]UZQ85530.1 50S ribosomal protein L22 [Thermoclostridium stercorarium]
MGRKVMSRDELLEKKDEILAQYRQARRKSEKLPILTKKEKKILGIGKDEGRAVLRNVRVSSRKAKLVIDLIRNKKLDEAYAILRYTPKRAAGILEKLLKSAEANAVNNNGLNRDNLYVAEIYATQGPTMKRIRPRAHGRAYRINKRTSHITVVLREMA